MDGRFSGGILVNLEGLTNSEVAHQGKVFARKDETLPWGRDNWCLIGFTEYMKRENGEI